VPRSVLSAASRSYERELRSPAHLRGRLDVELTIREAGNVTDVHAVESTVGSDDVEACVIRVLGGFRFYEGPTGGDVAVAVSFSFAPPPRTD
jgi:hypothetical protein